jgi:metal transporter CNNM
MVLLFIIAWPLSKLLDLVLGNSHSQYFERSELKELVMIHSEEKHGPLSIDECTIIKGALDMKNKKATACMTPLESVFMLHSEVVINKETLSMVRKVNFELILIGFQIYESGHSRIPVYKDSRQNIIGLLFVKRLITLDASDDITLSQLVLPQLITVPSSKDLYELLNEFQTGKCTSMMFRI